MQIRGWALGLLGIKPSELDTIEAPVFWEALRVRSEEKNADRRHIGELIRGASLRLFNTQVKHPVREPQKFWEMPWDEELNRTSNFDDLMSLSREERLKLADDFMKRTEK